MSQSLNTKTPSVAACAGGGAASGGRGSITINGDIPMLALNTFKGGVSKTSTAYNMAWDLSSNHNIAVVLADCDPQSNLSQIYMEAFDEDTNARVFREIYPPGGNGQFTNLGEALTAITDQQWDVAQASDNLAVWDHPQNDKLHLLAGSLAITAYEENLASVEVSKVNYGRHVPSALYFLIQSAAKRIGAQVIILDTSPSMGCLNMVLVMTSHFFIIPCQADRFSLNALITARKRITEMTTKPWVERIALLQDYTAESKHPLPSPHKPKFLGVVSQMFTVKRGKAARAFQNYINLEEVELRERFVPALAAHDMVDLAIAPEDSYILAQVPNFNRFAPMAQQQGLPLMALLEDDARLVNYDNEDHPIPLTGKMLRSAKKDVRRMLKPIKHASRVILYRMGFLQEVGNDSDDDEDAQDDQDDQGGDNGDGDHAAAAAAGGGPASSSAAAAGGRPADNEASSSSPAKKPRPST